MTTTAYTLRIPKWFPCTVNELLGSHWRTRHRMRKDDDQVVGCEAFNQEIPKATGRRRVTLTVTLKPRQRGGDPDCYFKSLVDALVNCGLLIDDSPKWCELAPVIYKRGTWEFWGTVILLEEV